MTNDTLTLYGQLTTLAIPFPEDDVHSKLNGRIFIVKVRDGEKDSEMQFVDAFSGEVLITSTKTISEKRFGSDYRTVTTESGTVYNLRRLKSIIPTQLIDTKAAKASEETQNKKIVVS